MTETKNTPALPDDEQSPDRVPATPRTKRTLLIAGGSLLGAALLVGGGVALGSALDDDDDDGVRSSTSDTLPALGSDRDDVDRDDVDRDADDAPTAAASATVGASSATELNEILQAASEQAEGEPVAIDANGDGSWDVQLRSSTGAETEIRIADDGTATVTSTETADSDDVAPQVTLDPETVRALVDAALAEVDGTITDLEADDDPTTPYDVSVVTADRRTVDLQITADMTVAASDTDD